MSDKDVQALISIHALREEGDISYKPIRRFFAIFLSTPSARRATQMSTFSLQNDKISIHALREEGDHKKRGDAMLGY